jgi:hypothetical protein
MNYQGAVWQEIFPECHDTNAAPQRSLLNQGKQLWQGLEIYILNSARMYGFKACIVTAPCTLTKIRYLRGERSRTTGVLEDDGQPFRGSRGFCGRTLSHLTRSRLQIWRQPSGYDFGALNDAVR